MQVQLYRLMLLAVTAWLLAGGLWFAQTAAPSVAAQESSIKPAVKLAPAAPSAQGRAMPSARSQHTATQLPNGKVLLVGGKDGNTPLNTSVLYDPANGRWIESKPMAAARFNHVAVMLQNGRVLVAGGQNQNGFLDSAETGARPLAP